MPCEAFPNFQHINAPNFWKKCATFCAVLRNFLRTWLQPTKNVAYKPINTRNIMIDCATSCALRENGVLPLSSPQ